MPTKEFYIAAHEAAHAIAALACGTRVYSIALLLGRDGATSGRCTIATADDAISRYAIARAGEICCGPRAGPESREDVVEKTNALALAAMATGDTIRATFEGNAMARTIIKKNNRLIRRLAKRLILKRRLTGAEFEDIRVRVKR